MFKPKCSNDFCETKNREVGLRDRIKCESKILL